MIRQRIYVERYDWLVYCYFDCRADDADVILRILDEIGINDEQYARARSSLHRSVVNSGMTFSNIGKSVSVVVISHTSSPEQTLNTFSHELRHLADDIGLVNGIAVRGEEIAYLTGDIAMALASRLLEHVCECPICSCH